ncbi:MAG: divalent-cation tolerance protein CutA [Candidatus Saccharicenans sp.]|nr:divalent-cation tolerance protein CutA [Candidatus Saccharicenans sp.]
MPGETDLIVVLTTFPSAEKAGEAARILLARKLAACCTILPGISLYTWQGKTCEENEAVMLIKTRTARYPELEKKIKEIHPYQVPEIVALPAVSALRAYSDWVKEVTGE